MRAPGEEGGQAGSRGLRDVSVLDVHQEGEAAMTRTKGGGRESGGQAQASVSEPRPPDAAAKPHPRVKKEKEVKDDEKT